MTTEKTYTLVDWDSKDKGFIKFGEVHEEYDLKFGMSGWSGTLDSSNPEDIKKLELLSKKNDMAMVLLTGIRDFATKGIRTEYKESSKDGEDKMRVQFKRVFVTC